MIHRVADTQLGSHTHMPILANVSFGIYALMPLGWAFMIATILLEIVLFSRLASGIWWNDRVVVPVIVANVVSGAAGFGLSLLLNGGWWLVVWMPWVSSNEIDFSRHLAAISVYYAGAFMLSVLIEGLLEQVLLMARFDKKATWRACFLSNLASYVIGSVAMYSWSFGLWD